MPFLLLTCYRSFHWLNNVILLHCYAESSERFKHMASALRQLLFKSRARDHYINVIASISSLGEEYLTTCTVISHIWGFMGKWNFLSLTLSLSLSLSFFLSVQTHLLRPLHSLLLWSWRTGSDIANLGRHLKGKSLYCPAGIWVGVIFPFLHENLQPFLDSMCAQTWTWDMADSPHVVVWKEYITTLRVRSL